MTIRLKCDTLKLMDAVLSGVEGLLHLFGKPYAIYERTSVKTRNNQREPWRSRYGDGSRPERNRVAHRNEAQRPNQICIDERKFIVETF